MSVGERQWTCNVTTLKLAKVCRLWKDTIDGSSEIRLSIELWADGMVSGDARGATRAETLKALHQRRRAWLRLEWASRETFPVEQLSRAYELVGESDPIRLDEC
jgi:hypothetical protein